MFSYSEDIIVRRQEKKQVRNGRRSCDMVMKCHLIAASSLCDFSIDLPSLSLNSTSQGILRLNSL